MQSVKEDAAAFLASRRIAVTGVSRTPRRHGSNNVYRRLRERGCQVYAVKPNTNEYRVDTTAAAGSWRRNPRSRRRWESPRPAP